MRRGSMTGHQPELPASQEIVVKHEPIQRPSTGRDSVASDFALIAEAVADAFRGMSTRRFHTHWSCLRAKGS